MLQEFKKFALRGNVLDLAVGVIIGGAFNKIVSSLVNDIFMPIIGLLLGKVDFTNLFIALDGQAYGTLAHAKEVGAPTINYGLFINAVLDFLIMAFVIFLLVRQVNRWRSKDEVPAAPTTKECPYCLSTIPLQAKRCAHCTSALD